MENYSIIKDVVELNKFVNWLPDLEEHEMYYFSLLARNKYCGDIVHTSHDRQQLTRGVTTKDKLINKIQRLECPLGSYLQKLSPIPQEALALYMHPNPRNLKTATERSVSTLFEAVINKAIYCNPITKVTSEVAKAISKKVFVDIDYDNMDYEFFEKKALDIYINRNACSIVQTRGGLHVLITLSVVEEKFKKTWYTKLISLDEVNNTIAPSGDMLLPIPGCTQGNFTPRFILLDGITQ